MRTAETCPHRETPRTADGVESAVCRLLDAILEVNDADSPLVGRDACVACCEHPTPTLHQINPVLGSLLSRRAGVIAAIGGRPGCDDARTTALASWARQSLRTVVAAGAGPPSPLPGIALPSAAIVIPCHDYGHFLCTAIESALAQTVHAQDIIVVDDASSDGTAEVASQFRAAGVRYLLVEQRNVYQARRAGLEATHAEVLCFLDADDLLPPDYLARGLPYFLDTGIGIVYSDVEYFGDRAGIVSYPEFNPGALEFDNYMHAGSLVRRRALEISGAYTDRPVAQSRADWMVWRLVVAAGWRGAKQPALYRYRRHPASMIRSFARLRPSYYQLAHLDASDITIFTALSGREALWPGYRQWLLEQQWPKERCRLILMDTSGDAAFGAAVRRFLADCSYPDTHYIAAVVAERGLADRPRRENLAAVRLACARIYNRMAQDVSTPFVLVVEDDVLPPLGVVEKLLRAFDPRTVAVAAPYRSRFHSGFTARNGQNQQLYSGEGVGEIGGCGFGCILIRRAGLHGETFGFGYGEPDDFDYAFVRRVSRKGWTIKMEWTQLCQHLASGSAGTDPASEHPAKESSTP